MSQIIYNPTNNNKICYAAIIQKVALYPCQSSKTRIHLLYPCQSSKTSIHLLYPCQSSKTRIHLLYPCQSSKTRIHLLRKQIYPNSIINGEYMAGVSAEISNGNPIGPYPGKIVSGATGRPIVRSFRPWGRGRGRPEISGDQRVPLPPKWTSDRRALRRRSSGIWTGGCGRLKTFSQSRIQKMNKCVL